MKRKLISMLFVMAALVFTGCGNKGENQSEVISTELAQAQETSADEENTGDDIIIEETQISQEDSQPEIIVEGNNGTISIGTIGSPYNELLTQAKIILAKEGWDVQITTYSDYEQMNQELLEGKLDGHLFAHQTYLDSYNDVNGTSFISIAPVCFEKYGIYSVLNEDLTKITANVTVGIPQDNARKARALLFLEDLGYITLKEGVGLTAVLEDVAENSKNIQFVEYTMDTAEAVLAEADYCVMGADQAILAGLEPEKDVLKEETAQMNSAQSMAALLVTTQENAESEKLSLLIEALRSETVQKYVEDTYKGALGLYE